MDSANKQTAVVAEVTPGTTPSSPAFKLLRETRVSTSSQRSATRSPERRPDRAAASFYKNLATFSATIEMPFTRDAGTDLLLVSALSADWSTNVLKNGSTRSAVTMEEKLEGGSTDPYRRLAGCQVDSLSLSLRNGEPGTMSFALQGMSETTATSALESSTYAAPTPGYPPVTPADIVANDVFGVTTPKVMSLNMTIAQNLRPQHSWGSINPFGIGLGMFGVEGSIQLYLGALADYSAFVTPVGGLTLDLTIGSQANYKDQIVLTNCVVSNPNIDDPGASGDHMLTLNFMGMYASGSSSVITWTRNVA